METHYVVNNFANGHNKVEALQKLLKIFEHRKANDCVKPLIWKTSQMAKNPLEHLEYKNWTQVPRWRIKRIWLEEKKRQEEYTKYWRECQPPRWPSTYTGTFTFLSEAS